MREWRPQGLVLLWRERFKHPSYDDTAKTGPAVGPSSWGVAANGIIRIGTKMRAHAAVSLCRCLPGTDAVSFERISGSQF